MLYKWHRVIGNNRIILYNWTCIRPMVAMWLLYVSFHQELLLMPALAANLKSRNHFPFLPFVSKYKIWPMSVPLTWGRPEGTAVLFGPAGWVEAWVEVKEPEGCGCVWEALGAYQAQLQPPSDILLHLSGPGQPQVNIVLELHVAACTQELHRVSTALGLRGGGGKWEADSAHTYTNTNEHTPRQGEEFALGENALHD